MNYIGIGMIIGIMILGYKDLDEKLLKISKAITGLNRRTSTKETRQMSEMIKSMIGEKCIITALDGSIGQVVTILGVDEEWVKIDSNHQVIMKRIDDIKELTIVAENMDQDSK